MTRRGLSIDDLDRAHRPHRSRRLLAGPKWARMAREGLEELNGGHNLE